MYCTRYYFYKMSSEISRLLYSQKSHAFVNCQGGSPSPSKVVDITPIHINTTIHTMESDSSFSDASAPPPTGRPRRERHVAKNPEGKQYTMPKKGTRGPKTNETPQSTSIHPYLCVVKADCAGVAAASSINTNADSDSESDHLPPLKNGKRARPAVTSEDDENEADGDGEDREVREHSGSPIPAPAPAKKAKTSTEKAKTDEEELGECWPESDILTYMNYSVDQQRSWHSKTYSYFEPTVKIQYVNGRKAHVFTCLNRKKCGGAQIRRYQDKQDKSSTHNLGVHVDKCWGEGVRKAVKEADLRIDGIREKITRPFALTGKVSRMVF
jgi:hypothetical protein